MSNEDFQVNQWEKEHEAHKLGERVRWFFILFICLLMLCGPCALGHAYSFDELVTAIGKAENSKTHPYGVMIKYRFTSPKQACLNTIKHQHGLWLKSGQKQPFLEYLADKYCPYSVDPIGNLRWKHNMTILLRRTHGN